MTSQRRRQADLSRNIISGAYMAFGFVAGAGFLALAMIAAANFSNYLA